MFCIKSFYRDTEIVNRAHPQRMCSINLMISCQLLVNKFLITGCNKIRNYFFAYTLSRKGVLCIIVVFLKYLLIS